VLEALCRLLLGLEPELDWIQVEVTTHCNAKCVYCPHTTHSDAWQRRELPIETVESLAPSLAIAPHVHLQGWGEPLTHPNFVDMVRTAKAAGCAVGTTTNGMLLDDEMAGALVGEGLDVLAFSVAGVDEANDAIRRGTRLATVVAAIEKVRRERERSGADHPKIHMAYMLLRSRLGDIERWPEFFANSGVDEVVVSTLPLVTRSGLERETLQGMSSSDYAAVRARLLDAKEASRDRGVAVHFHITPPVRSTLKCPENVGRALVIAADGQVSPCVMANIPAAMGAERWTDGTKRPLDRLSFGSVVRDTLEDVWFDRAYGKFRRAVAAGPLPECCTECGNLGVDDLSDAEPQAKGAD